MNTQKQLDDALALLHDFISNYGAEEDHYEILNNAEKALKQLNNKGVDNL